MKTLYGETHLIYECPNNCKFCSSNSNCNKTQIIEFDTFKKVIDYFISTGGIGELSISGGEPFLHPDIFKMIEYLKNRKLGEDVIKEFEIGLSLESPDDLTTVRIYF